MILKAEDVIRPAPELCGVGEVVPLEAVPHWDSRIRLVEFFRTDPDSDGKPWMFAATYKGMEVCGWRRID